MKLSGAEVLDLEAIAASANYALTARIVAEGTIGGFHKSAYIGYNAEFSHHREYIPGDDLKHMDWRRYARTQKYYVKQYEESSSLNGLILLDRSPSMQFDHKIVYASVLASSLAYLLLHQGDGMGFLSFDAQMQDYLPISKRMSNFGALLQFLQSPLRSGTTSLQKSLESILPTLKRRCLILLISDFLERQDDLHQALARLSHARHEIMAFHVLSPKELDFPWEEYGEFVDMESGQSLAVEGRTIQATYAARLKEFLQITEGLMRQHKADYQLMSTAHPLRKALHHFLYRRSRQV